MSNGYHYENFLLFNPEGRIKQLEYANMTHELGTTCLALCNDKAGVLIAHAPARTKLAEPQQKIFPVTESAVFTFSGITNDGMDIVNMLKDASIRESVLHCRPIHYLHVFDDFSYDASLRAFWERDRVFGIQGIFMMDYDGIKLVHLGPTGMVYQCIGAALGNRAQSCNSILEKEASTSYSEKSAEELIQIGLRAFWNAYPDPAEQNMKKEDIQIVVLEAGKKLRMVIPS